MTTFAPARLGEIPARTATLACLLALACASCGARSPLRVDDQDAANPPPAQSLLSCARLEYLDTVTLGDALSEDARPCLAFDGSRFVVAWARRSLTDPTAREIRLAHIGLDGAADSPTGFPAGFADVEMAPSLAVHSGELGLLYNRVEKPWLAPHTVLARFDDDFQPVGALAELDLAKTGALSATAGGYAAMVAAADSSVGYSLVRAGLDGSTVATPVSTDGEVFRPHIVTNPLGFAAAWLTGNKANSHTAWLAMLGTDGAPKAAPVQIGQGTGVLALAGWPGPLPDRYLAAFVENAYGGADSGPIVQPVDANGTLQGQSQYIAPTPSMEGYGFGDVSLAATDVGFVLAVSRGWSVDVTLLGPDGTPGPTATTPLDRGPQLYDVAYGSGAVMVAYSQLGQQMTESDIRIARFACQDATSE